MMGWLTFAAQAQVSAEAELQRLITQVKSARADFVQRVHEPARPDRPPRIKTSSGHLAFERPNRFRWTYVKPFEQTLLADGRQFWMHDPDLAQVTVKPQPDDLRQTALGAIASVTDMASLKQRYAIQALAPADGLVSLVLTPHAADGPVRELRLAWRDGQLARMVLLDGLGQRTEWHLSNWQDNPNLPEATFRWVTPPGTEVIRTR
jgi:outer membrane lipoprotein carrier protein